MIWKLIIILMMTPMLSSCIINVLDTSDRLDYKNGITLDTNKNRNFYIAAYERTIAQESKGTPPPPAYGNWNSLWNVTYRELRNGTVENPEFYINHIKHRRKDLGLPR